VKQGIDAPYTPSWYALYTRARHEKKVESALRQHGLEAYLPLLARESQWHDRKKTILWPMFPSYIFARFDSRQTAQVVALPGVASVVKTGNRPATILASEIDNIRLLVSSVTGAGKLSAPVPLVEQGQVVSVTEGPFAGVTGRVVERRGDGRVLLQIGVSAIGQGVRLEIKASSVRPSRRQPVRR